MKTSAFGAVRISARIAAWLRRAPLLLILAGVSLEPALATTYYVANNGNDASNGKATSTPFLTVQKAMNAVSPGDTVLIRAGTYREDVEVIRGGAANAYVTVANYPGETPTISGSKVVTGWVSDGGAVWKKTGWTVNSQQVFVDFAAHPANSLQQIGMPSSYYSTWEYPTPVGSGRSTMKAGSFYYDKAAATLYVWLADGSNPNNHVMEASVQRRLFSMQRPYIYLRGIRFRHSNLSAFAQQGGAIEMSSHSVIEGCDVQYMDFAGISMGYLADGAVAQYVTSSNNGNSGILAAASTNFRVNTAIMKGNNTRNFNTNWHAGGFKGAANSYGTIENSEIGNNKGPGVWFDHARAAQPTVVRNNFIHNNTPGEGAIFFEASKNGLFYNNVIANNLRRGVYLSASDNTRVYNNTIYGTSERAGIEVNGMPRDGATLTNNAITNNIISNGTSLYDLYIVPTNGGTIVNNTSDYNNYYRPSGSIQLRYSAVYTSLAPWRSATHLDTNSKSVNPNFVAAGGSSAAGYEVKAGSPVIDGGKNLAGTVPNDYLKLARPSGGNYDIGAFEFVASTVAVTQATTLAATTTTALAVTVTPATSPAPSSTTTGAGTSTSPATTSSTSSTTSTPTILAATAPTTSTGGTVVSDASIAASSATQSKAKDPGARGGDPGAGLPIAGLSGTQSAMFNTGRDDFAEAETVAEGLGPRMNLDSCAGCHSHPSVGGSSPAINPQVAFATKNGGTDRVPSFIKPNGPVREARFVRNPDGTPDGGVHSIFTITGRIGATGCSLAQPDFESAVASRNVIFRIPTPVFGLGLIEQIPDVAILANLTNNAAQKNALGIRGRVNYHVSGRAITGQSNRNGNDGTIARFGWKSQNKSLLVFSGEAYNVEMGITNELFQTERSERAECQFARVPNDTTNLDAHTLAEGISGIEKFALYMRFLAPPVPSAGKPGGSASIARGRTQFASTGCAACHTPTMRTGNSSVAALNNKNVNLYSDLLTHDMGVGLSDGISQGQAGPREFRTAPLWGLGQRIYFLHDGRAANLLDAIQAHQSSGSEANAVVNNYNALTESLKQDLLNFLRSL